METGRMKTAASLFRSVSLILPPDFSGTGVIFYDHLEDLPFVSLGSHGPARPKLPITGMENIASVLAQVSSLRSSFHDGFHFIDLTGEKLTHLAQFVSPPLPKLLKGAAPNASGARHMTALLSSKVRGIAGVGVLASAGQVYYYQDGECLAGGVAQ